MLVVLATADPGPRREALHGVRQIVRFNWPFYGIAAVVVVIAALVVARLPIGLPASVGAYAGIGLAALWTAGSLVASWLVYDRSALMTGTWIPPALGFRPGTWLTIHAGFDELTPAVRALLPHSHGRALDIFDPLEMTEPSIARARHATTIDAERADFRRLPAPSGAIDAVFFLLSAHELRTHPARRTLFAEVSRTLAPGGRVVVAEHLRDAANFMAFGPGFLHFHSHRTWTRCFTEAGLGVYEEFSITPFVRVFILRRVS